jgi:hypothetical protein
MLGGHLGDLVSRAAAPAPPPLSIQSASSRPAPVSAIAPAVEDVA